MLAMTDLLNAYGDPVTKADRRQNPLDKADMKTEDGLEYPPAAYAYVGDPDVVATWKLRLWETPELKETRRQIGMAIAALGPGGFRGNRVQIPADDLPGVKRRVLNAWLKVWPNKERTEAPRVLLSTRRTTVTATDARQTKMERHYEGLGQKTAAADRRQPFLSDGEVHPAVNFNEETEVEAAGYEEWEKDHDYGDVASGGDAMTHLLMAYRMMIDHPECQPLLVPLMEIIHAKEQIMVDLVDEDELVIPMGESQHEDEYDKEIREEDGQFCVYSPTGRAFGCYANEAEAVARLEQIERFRTDRVAAASTDQLISDHDQLHALGVVRVEHVVIHNLVEDELESRGVAPPYLLGDVEDKLRMIGTGMSGHIPVIKQAEHRYTLGPVYVPGVEDAHGEFVDEDTRQKALWEWVRKGDRRIFIQHSDKVAGEMVEALTWPFPIEADLEVPDQGITKQVFPANTPFLGVVWEPWAWELVQAGELRGYSIGGRAKRVEADLPEMATV